MLSRIFQQSQPPSSSCTAGSQSSKYISQTASVQIANDRGQTALSTPETALSLLDCEQTRPVRRKKQKNELLLLLAFSAFIYFLSNKPHESPLHTHVTTASRDPLLHGLRPLLSTHHRGRSREVCGPYEGVLASCFRFLRHDPGIPTPRASKLPAGAAACCTGPAADSS